MHPAILILSLFALISTSVQAPTLSAIDINRLKGNNWTGKIIYLDYKSEEKVTLKCNLAIKPDPADKNAWTFDFSYPEEPKANRSSRVVLSKDGKVFDEEKVVSASKADGTLSFTTEARGQDNNKPSTFRHIYEASKDSFVIIKMVKYDGEKEFFERNRYSWRR